MLHISEQTADKKGPCEILGRPGESERKDKEQLLEDLRCVLPSIAIS